jgi:hypothetical protein
VVSFLGELKAPAPPIGGQLEPSRMGLTAVPTDPNLCVRVVPGPSRPPCDVYCQTVGGQNMGLKERAGAPTAPIRSPIPTYTQGNPHSIAATTNRMITSNASIPTTMSPNRPALILLAPPRSLASRPRAPRGHSLSLGHRIQTRRAGAPAPTL